MDITLFVINTVICAMFWLLSRLCCAWIGHLCEASAGQTTRDVEQHASQFPQEKLFPWLMRISPRPRLTALFHYLFRGLTSLPLLGMIVGITLPFVPAWEVYARYLINAMFVLYMVLFVLGLVLFDPLHYRWTGKYR